LDKLLMDVRFNTNPDFGTYQADLVQKHNALFRQRASMERERSEKDTKDPAVELRKIAMQICPKQKAKKKKTAVNFDFLKDLKGGLHKDLTRSKSLCFEEADPSQNHLQEGFDIGSAHEEAKEADLDDDMYGGDAPLLWASSGSYEDTGDFRLESNALSTGPGDFASQTSNGFFFPPPSSLQEEGVGFLQPLPKVQRPMGPFTLLLYRNGDRHHNGEAVFIRRPPKDLKELLTKCCEGCRVSVGPPEALYNRKMRPVKELREVEGGGMFVLKGQEALDPPPAFFASGEPEGGSMRKLTTFQRANKENAAQLLDRPHAPWSEERRLLGKRALTFAEMSTALEAQLRKVLHARGLSQDVLPESLQALWDDLQKAPTPESEQMHARLPLVGGPCLGAGRMGSSPEQRKGETWAISEKLSLLLGHGGQVGLFSGSHHDFNVWPRTSALCSSIYSSRSSGNLSNMRSTR
jgi:hypothetical protein